MSLACPSLIAHHYPDLCRAIDIYCERTSSALDAEPFNALSNIAFLIAAACAWRLQFHHLNRAASKLTPTLIALTAIVGLGSFLFHTVATLWAEWGDIIPIMVFMLLYLWFILTSFFDWSFWTKFFALSIFFAATFSLQLAAPSTFLMGGVLYMPALFAMATIGGVLYPRLPAAGRVMIAATAVFLLSLTARTLDAPVCTSFPLGTHFLWHLLNALLLYLLLRIGILYAPRQGARQLT
jgi:hypothetical protein